MVKTIMHKMKDIFRQQWNILLIASILAVISSISFFIHFRNNLDFNVLNSGDYLFWNFRGMQWLEQSSLLVIPNGYWMAVNFLLAFIIGKRFADITEGAEMQIILRSDSWRKWWKHKYYECVISVILYYTVLIGVIVLCSFVLGSAIGIPHSSLLEEYGGFDFINSRFFLTAILLMILTSVTISVIQALITVISNIKLGFIWVSLVLVLTIYSDHFWDFGNGIMLNRSSGYRTIHYVINYTLCFALIIITYGIGRILIKKQDLIKKEKREG